MSKIQGASAPERYRVDRANQYWAIFNAQGERVSGFHTDRSTAEDACARLIKAASKQLRSCLCCGRNFQSEGAHNRLCDGCRRRTDEMGSPVALPNRGGRSRA